MNQSEKAIALCLSGGGFRAALFHLGSLRRLNEFGILSQVDLISTVSGGAILAGHLASHIRSASNTGVPWPRAGGVWPAFDVMASQLHVKTSRHFRIGGTLSFNEVLVRKLPRAFKEWAGPMRLMELPAEPEFIFNATELNTGRLWSFSRSGVGSDEIGYTTRYGHALVAEAVAASACFPVFDQLEARFQPKDFEGGTVGDVSTEWNVLLADGGIFDNLGLEKVINSQTILVSNGGRGAGPLPAPAGIDHPPMSAPISSPSKTQFDALRWILGTASRDAAPARRRLDSLARRFDTNAVAGAYWSIGDGCVDGAPVTDKRYSQKLAQEMIATVRTQLDAFSDSERHVLENQGYLVTDFAIRMQAPNLIRVESPTIPPWPNALSAEFVHKHLRDSANISSGWRAIRKIFSS